MEVLSSYKFSSNDDLIDVGQFVKDIEDYKDQLKAKDEILLKLSKHIREWALSIQTIFEKIMGIKNMHDEEISKF